MGGVRIPGPAADPRQMRYDAFYRRIWGGRQQTFSRGHFEFPNVPFTLTAGVVSNITGLRSHAAAPFVDPLNTYLQHYKIASIRRMAAFFGQVVVESEGFTRLEERLDYSAERVKAVFEKRLVERHVHAADYAHNPQKLANFAYSGKNGNGDEASGDGYRYRGRGLLQITGRGNYERAGDMVGVPAVAQPELLSHPHYAVLTSCAYWSQNHINDPADIWDLHAVTRRINSAMREYDRRVAATDHARRALRLALGLP